MKFINIEGYRENCDIFNPISIDSPEEKNYCPQTYFAVNNIFSELITESEKLQARTNLDISWKNLLGEVESAPGLKDFVLDQLTWNNIHGDTTITESLGGDEVIIVNQDGENKAVKASTLIKGAKEIIEISIGEDNTFPKIKVKDYINKIPVVTQSNKGIYITKTHTFIEDGSEGLLCKDIFVLEYSDLLTTAYVKITYRPNDIDEDILIELKQDNLYIYPFNPQGNGNKFLADNGTYKEVPSSDYDDTEIKAQIKTNADVIAANKVDIDSKLSQLGSKFSIYDLSATGKNVSKFTGIKDLVIKNPKDGLVYTVTSIEKSSDSAKINIYSSIDNVGTSYTRIASLEASNPQSSEREYFHVIGKNKEEIFAAIIWSEIPEGSFSQMWNNEYPLSNKVFQNGVSSDFAIMKMVEERETELLNDKVPSSVKNIFYNELNLGSYVSGDTRIKDGGVIECYLHESVTSNEGDIVISTMLNKDGICSVTIVNGGTILGSSSIESTSLQYPILLHTLERNGIVAGYMLVDWDKVSNFEGVGTGILNKKRCSIFFGSSSCLFEYIKNAYSTKEDVENILGLVSENVVKLTAGGINYETGVNIPAGNTYRTDFVPITHDVAINVTGNIYYKNIYVIKYLDRVYVGYEKNKLEITANPAEFNQIRLRIDYTSENDVDTLLRTSVVVRRQDGVLYKSDKKYLEKDNLVFKEDYVPLPNVGMFDLSTGRYSSGALNFVTSDYISVFPNQKMSVLFGGYGNAGIAGFSDKQGNGFAPVYKNSSTVPLKETEVVNIVIPNGVYYIRITSYKALLDYSSISYDKSINIDLLKNLVNRENISPTEIWNGYVTLRLLNILSNGSICDFSAHRLNFNIPNDDDKIFMSTDIYNTEYRDNPTEQDLVKAFAPMLFYKRKKVGCFVLFDTENNNKPFIYDANGRKKYLTLTDE